MSRDRGCDRLVRDGRRGLEEVPDASGEVALEAADRVFGALALGALASDVVLCFAVAAQAGDRDAVDRGVDLAVAAAVEPVTAGVAGADRDRGDPGGPGELGVRSEPLGAGDLADELGCGERAEPWLSEQVRRDLDDEVSDLAFQLLDRLGQVADAAQLVARNPDADGLVGSGEPPRDAWSPGAVKQRAGGELQVGPEVVQMPLQRVVDRDALTDQSLAVIDQQAQVKLGPV